jgi:hypothetical protein
MSPIATLAILTCEIFHVITLSPIATSTPLQHHVEPCGVTKVSVLLGRRQKPFGKIERRYSMTLSWTFKIAKRPIMSI